MVVKKPNKPEGKDLKDIRISRSKMRMSFIYRFSVTRAMSLILLLLFLPVLAALEIPPTERSFRFLVVNDGGEPAEGVPLIWVSEVYIGLNAYGGRLTKEIERKIIFSGKDGTVQIPKHKFSTFSIAIRREELKSSSVWMVDSKTQSQSFYWDVYYRENPQNGVLGPPTPGFDAVFKVLSKQGISNLYRYNSRHMQVPCDGTPTPLRVLGGPSAQVKNPEEADVVITITRPDQEIFAKESKKPEIAKPLCVPWVLESTTLRFAHFADDTDLSTDYRHRTWTQRLEVLPTHPDHAASDGWQVIRLWAMIPGEKPLVVPVACSVGLSFDSRTLNKAVYEAGFEVILPLAPCTRYHPDLLSIGHYTDLAPEISGDAINLRLDPIRAGARAHPFPTDLITTPVLRYDTNPNPQGEGYQMKPPVLLPADKP
jgi:hypothetical protein